MYIRAKYNYLERCLCENVDHLRGITGQQQCYADEHLHVRLWIADPVQLRRWCIALATVLPVFKYRLPATWMLYCYCAVFMFGSVLPCSFVIVPFWRCAALCCGVLIRHGAVLMRAIWARAGLSLYWFDAVPYWSAQFCHSAIACGCIC